MWFFRTGVVVLLLAAAGCGFRPMYGGAGDPEDVLGELSEIKVAVIADRSGQQMRNALMDLLTPRGVPATPRYLLEVDLDEVISEVAVERTGLATRANLSVEAQFKLVDNRSGVVVLSDRSFATSSYNLLDTAQFSTLTSENDARRRTIDRIAREIRTRLGVHFASDHAAVADSLR
ncbi:MAG: hypothetical protein IPM60_16085 [Rhodospirillales bacterium]|nr:hypothetical protein [Rhodospirillales bacterium]